LYCIVLYCVIVFIYGDW